MRTADFEALVAAHHQTVIQTAHRLLRQREDAKDAAQEVFLRLFRNHATVRGDLCGWLYRVTVNVCYDHYRRRKPTRELGLHRADSAPNPECMLRIKERQRLVTDALNSLTARERAAVILRDIEGLSAAEVATILDVRQGTVRSRIHSARIKLAHYVKTRC